MIDPADIGKDGRRYKLTLKQLAFVDNWLSNGGNASEAYRQAFPGSDKWSNDALRVKASQTLALPKVQAEINKRQAAVMDNVQITAEMLISRNLARAQQADAAGQHAAAVAAETLAAKLAGLLIDKVDQTTRNASPQDHKPDLSAVRAQAESEDSAKPTTH